MTLNTIDKLVSNEGWNIQSWRFRYGTELWVIASPLAEQLDQIREITEGADIEAIELASYFNNEGSWLPVVSAKNISEGLEMLEQKIKVFENIEEWKQKVVGTFSRIIEVNDGGYGFSIAGNEKKESIFFAPDGLNNPFFM
ncbi:hypothetical protein [Paenibacillus sp. FSL K6-2859]|uniref:hypothetical protein n=1 Tax=Paenibacillus sp. FSL K6-2859 TaxID=2921482 RepID=UPI0030F698D6